MAGLKLKLNEIPQRLKRFISHDVRKNPILGLYLVIGVMVVGYAIYFAAVMYKDFTTKPEQQVASSLQIVQPEKTPVPEKQVQPEQEVPSEEVTEQKTAVQEEPTTEKAAEKPEVKAEVKADNKIDISKWHSFEFQDSSHISFPSDWSRSDIPAEKNVIQAISLQAPKTRASLKCYFRSRQYGNSYAKSLKDTMRRAGYTNIKDEAKKINKLEVVQLSGVLADKHMAVTVFNHKPDRYFIVRLIASKKEYATLQPYYTAIVNSYRDAGMMPASAVSIEKIEQQLEKSIESEKDYLVGSTIWIKLSNGARHQGVVIAEDDTTLTLESFRFGGRYSFTVKKEDIVEIVR
jgi:hypothetical protein